MKRILVYELIPGMITAEDVYNYSDQLIIPKKELALNINTLLDSEVAEKFPTNVLARCNYQIFFHFFVILSHFKIFKCIFDFIIFKILYNELIFFNNKFNTSIIMSKDVNIITNLFVVIAIST